MPNELTNSTTSSNYAADLTMEDLWKTYGRLMKKCNLSNCPHCGGIVEQHHNYCPRCGGILKYSFPANPIYPSAVWQLPSYLPSYSWPQAWC